MVTLVFDLQSLLRGSNGTKTTSKATLAVAEATSVAEWAAVVVWA